MIYSDTPIRGRHKKCKGYETNTPDGREFQCGYNTSIECDECKYGLGRKDPAAKCNSGSNIYLEDYDPI